MKIRAIEELAHAKDLTENLATARSDQKRYTNMMFGDKKGEDEADGDIIVADNITHTIDNSVREDATNAAAKLKKGIPIALALAGMVATGGLGAGLMALPSLLNKDEPPIVKPVEDTDTDTILDPRFGLK